MTVKLQKGFCVETSVMSQEASTIERSALVLMGTHPASHSILGQWMKCGVRWCGTHGHSQVGFHSRSGWEGRSWWWIPEAGNLSDNGIAPCSQPATRTEVSHVTFHLAVSHSHILPGKNSNSGCGLCWYHEASLPG